MNFVIPYFVNLNNFKFLYFSLKYNELKKYNYIQIHTLNRMPTAFEYKGPSGLTNTG